MLRLMVMMIVTNYDLMSHVLVDKLQDSEIQKPGQVSRINSSYQLQPRDILLLMEEILSS